MREWLVVKLLKIVRKLIVEKYGEYVSIKIYGHWLSKEKAEQFASKVGEELGVLPVPYCSERVRWVFVGDGGIEVMAFLTPIGDNDAK